MACVPLAVTAVPPASDGVVLQAPGDGRVLAIAHFGAAPLRSLQQASANKTNPALPTPTPAATATPGTPPPGAGPIAPGPPIPPMPTPTPTATPTAAPDPWRKADVDHVLIALYRGTDVTPTVTQTVTQGQLAHTVSFARLQYDTDYRVTLQAWSDAAGTSRIDNLRADPDSCTVSFTTTQDDVAAVGDLKLRLADKTP